MSFQTQVLTGRSAFLLQSADRIGSNLTRQSMAPRSVFRLAPIDKSPIDLVGVGRSLLQFVPMLRGERGLSGAAGAMPVVEAIATTDGQQVIALPAVPSNADLYINGLRQMRSAFAIDGQTLVAPANLQIQTDDTLTVVLFI